MASQEYPTLNGVAPSWADLSLSIPLYNGPTIKTPDVAALKWSDSVEMGVVRGTNGGRKTKRTTGQYDCEGTLTLYKDGWETLRNALAQIDKRISLVIFDILALHTPPGSSGIYKVKLVSIRIAGRSEDMAEGSDASQVEIPLNIMRVEEGDGVSLL